MENGQEYRTHERHERLLVDAPVLCTWHHFPTLLYPTHPLSVPVSPLVTALAPRQAGTKREEGERIKSKGGGSDGTTVSAVGYTGCFELYAPSRLVNRIYENGPTDPYNPDFG